MATDNKQEIQAFLDTHAKLQEIAAELAPYERKFLSMDGLGMAGMEAEGVLEFYNAKSQERNKIVEALVRLRAEIGDKNLLTELEHTPGSELAIEYIQKVPLKENRQPSKEIRKGLFGRWR